VAGVWDVGQLEEALEEIGDDPVRRPHAILLQELKPDAVDIDDGILGKPKRVQRIILDSPGAFL
jgi:hypothetical protein